ncbi:thioredoxin family protein [Salinicoccus halitifaciens]|uniref:Thiol-disulfide isomerase/thioredoxin n=1 Tax=Salinicoccus halitifaciens TaxID=1073415 RepID=A0ABV2EBQ5_9STAP|nr:thioredoxin family protein [Salinicoccus halitifaciens]MCD2138821.1 thioredoxin family protein [Salinicoccus halitifaciens]
MKALRTYDDYRKAVRGNDAVIVKFYADWCPDCAIFNDFIPPIMEEYRYIKWFELNRDEVSQAADENDIGGIPDLLIFRKGAVTARLGAHNAGTSGRVREFLKENL